MTLPLENMPTFSSIVQFNMSQYCCKHSCAKTLKFNSSYDYNRVEDYKTSPMSLTLKTPFYKTDDHFEQ